MKTSNPKAKTARRFWSILLSLVMVLTMLPTAALADEPPVTGTFGIQVNTSKDGVAIPSPETFTFEITDRVESGTPKEDLSEYGITVLDQLEVKLTDFNLHPRPSTTIRVQVDPAMVSEGNGWTKEFGALGSPDYFKKYLTLKQTDGAKPGWTYDQREMLMRIAYYPESLDGTPAVDIRCYESGDAGTDTASFSNTYTSDIVSFPITKIVELAAGTAACPAETFSFKFDENPFASGIKVLDALEIPVSGAGRHEKSFRLEINPALITEENGWAPGSAGDVAWLEKSFQLTEINDGAPGWQYSDKTWVIRFTYFPATEDIMIRSAVSGDAYGPIEFTNIYTYTEGRYEIPFTKTVNLGGNTAPGRQTFELEIFDARGVGSADGLYTATVETRGAGSYDGSLIISGPAEEVENLVSEDFYVREKNAGEANWTYSKAVWHVEQDPDDPGNFVIFPATLQHSENGDYYVDAETPADRMAFENTYTYNTTSGGYDDDSGATIIVKKTDPAGTPLSGAVFALNNSRGDAVYEATSNSSGVARFTDVSNGTYTLVEQSAPEGYVMSEERYELEVRGSRVTMDGKTYAPVTFVNRRIAELNREDHFPFLIGYADGTFGPERNMTRAEVTTMFARLLTEQIEADKTYTNTFNDVPPSYWAADYIGYMQQFGIVMGFSDGSFRPDAPVTRAQFAAIASRFEKLTEGTKSFTDVPPTYWAAKYINFAATRGWVNGYADGTFRPANPITRAEVAAVTCRLLERTADQAYVRSHLAQLRTFRDMTEAHWAYWYAIEAANGHDYTKAGSGETWSRVHS